MKLIISFQDTAHGMRELLSYEGDVEEDFGLTFQVRKVALFPHVALWRFRNAWPNCSLSKAAEAAYAAAAKELPTI